MCVGSITPKRKKKVKQKKFLLQNWRRQAPSKIRKKHDFWWFWWKCKYGPQYCEEYSLYNVIVWHVRFIGKHLYCGLYRSVFLAFKYLTILRPKAQILVLDPFSVFEAVILLNKGLFANSDLYKPQSVYLWHKLNHTEQQLSVTYLKVLSAHN